MLFNSLRQLKMYFYKNLLLKCLMYYDVKQRRFFFFLSVREDSFILIHWLGCIKTLISQQYIGHYYSGLKHLCGNFIYAIFTTLKTISSCSGGFFFPEVSWLERNVENNNNNKKRLEQDKRHWWLHDSWTSCQFTIRFVSKLKIIQATA